ncbi:unnamed protein product [Mytilus coruscus]|uniref:Uncharacterized protein n=1 Tax=Mytilus coruscus TaxID=42192 RepID=A0A6J8AI45_MYTCO|nr:unnamed protein product [Mytilus coruscus]
MTASANINNDEVNNSVVACSQPIPPSQTLVIPTTNKKGVNQKDKLPATQKQESRQMRRRNSFEDLSVLGSQRGAAIKTSANAEKVLDALRSPDVLNQVIPILSNKINKLEGSVHQQAITAEEQNKEIDLLYQKVAKLEERMENQEQCSRRTSLRFNKISVPVDERCRIQHPVNTDELVLNVCNNKLGLNLTLKDISRSHTIGKARTELVTRLAQLKYNGGIHTYWTADGRIFVMKTQASRRKIIDNFDDISRIQHAQNDTNSSDQKAEGGEDWINFTGHSNKYNTEIDNLFQP